MALIKSDMDKMMCMDPSCDCDGRKGVVLSGRCHPGAPQKALYKNGLLFFSCGVCGAPVVEVQVAQECAGCGRHETHSKHEIDA
jgi:hypothetical protein